MRILLAEDRASLRTALAETLERAGYEVVQAAEGKSAMEAVKAGAYDCALFDLKMPVHGGMALLEASRERWPLVPVVLLTAYGSLEVAVGAMKAGAFDFLPKPVDPEHLLLVIQRALDSSRQDKVHEALSSELSRLPSFQGIKGESDALKGAQEMAARIAATNTTCLILGETGVGKELFARAIHGASPRSDQPFVAVNCAALPESLLENELFGHEKGAYTGAYDTAVGKFEYAHRGTIFLDEIGEMGAALQAKLLRVLEERCFSRIGGTEPVSVDVRLLCATNKDLEAMVADKRFREDLYYRLSAFPIRIPPLRDRREDIPGLAEHFLGHFGRELGRSGLAFSREALTWLVEQPWPGNVRQLMNHIERAAILADRDGTIYPADLEGGRGAGPVSIEAIPSLEKEEDPEAWLRAEERWRALEVLKRSGGDRRRAARLLGLSKKAFDALVEARNGR